MKVGIIANPHKPGAAKTNQSLIEVLGRHGIETELENDSAKIIGVESMRSASQLAESCDVIAVLGGDGTMLNATHRIGPSDTPLAGINIGTLGFLTSCTDDELELFAQALLENSYKVIPRILLETCITYADGRTESDFAVNKALSEEHLGNAMRNAIFAEFSGVSEE
jgi:NAD+ kinase